MIELYKKRGETPLEALQRLRIEKPELKDETLSYAGRLDPMAEGILPVLVGKKENQARTGYLNKDKEYKVEMMLGCSTDTGDVLGIVNSISNIEIIEDELKKVCEDFTNITKQTYPWFSSKTVNGIPLFVYAQKKDFSVIRPVREVKIYEVHNIEFRDTDTKELITSIIKEVANISGEFRQTEIIKTWDKSINFLSKNTKIFSFSIRVSSGTYIRALAEEIFNKTGISATLIRLERTKVF